MKNIFFYIILLFKILIASEVSLDQALIVANNFYIEKNNVSEDGILLDIN